MTLSASAPSTALRLAYAAVVFAAVTWGTWPLLLRWAARYGALDATLEAAVVMALVTLLTLPLAVRDRARVPSPRAPRDWALLATLGITDALNIFLLFAAYRRTSVAVAVLTHYLTPIFVAVAAPLALGERATARTSFAVVLAFTGLVVLLAPWRAFAADQGDAVSFVGAALGAGSAVFYASNVLIQKKLGGAFSASEVFGFHGLVSAPLLLAAVPMAAWRALDPRAFGVLCLGAVGPGTLAGLAFVWGLQHVPASHASTLTLLEPFVAVVVAALVFGELLGPLGVVGGLAILASAFLVVTATSRGSDSR